MAQSTTADDDAQTMTVETKNFGAYSLRREDDVWVVEGTESVPSRVEDKVPRYDLISEAEFTSETETIEAGDVVHSEDIEDCDEVFSADADRFGNICNALYETPAGEYVHLNYRPGESVQLNDGTVTTAYSVEQVGESIETDIRGLDEDVPCADFIFGDWPVYDSHWRGNNVSISTDMSAWPEDEVEPVREAADQHDLTFEVSLN